jgi:hypothetical protein
MSLYSHVWRDTTTVTPRCTAHLLLADVQDALLAPLSPSSARR